MTATSIRLKQRVPYLSPKEFKDALLIGTLLSLDTTLTTMAVDLGHFRGAIRQTFRNFLELPQWVRDHKESSWTSAWLCVLYTGEFVPL